MTPSLAPASNHEEANTEGGPKLKGFLSFSPTALRRSAPPPPPRPTLGATMLTAATSLAILTTILYRDTILASSTPAPSPHGSSIVDTGYAKYEGNRTFPNAVAYLGVPYAEPPLGRLRFRAPVPLNTSRVGLESGGKVVNAKNYPDFCIQGTTGSGDAGGAGSEDCLKVNVYAPAGATKTSKFPVLVYIHGGGYIYGNPRNWPFDHWVAQSPNTLIVSVYYRLSSFGFLAHPELRDDPTLGTLNAGFLDQIQALRWVKDHIASFGGDPGRVTINGESAGGASVALHLVASNEGEQLFNRAIAQSVYRTPVPMPEQQVPQFQYYADQAGCGKGAVAEQVECLRKAPVGALARAQDSARPPAFTASGYNTFHPVVDGKVLTDYPTKLILQGKFARVPLIVGATTNETLSGGVDIASALVKFFPSITDTDIEELGQAYPIHAFDSENLRFQVLTGESELKCANSVLGTAYSNAGLKTWVYRYNQRNPTNPNPAVTHAAENWMMFLGSNTGTNGSATFSPQTSTETAFASELIAYWLSFVRTGDPNTYKLPKSPTWNGYTAGTRNKIVLQQADTKDARKSGSFMEKETKEETERCLVVAGQVETQQN
ncbi:EstA protein [Ephemerocybe angulata]|uniref:Carboxylic ester hydrolase n=1 Tax=Ephemerocybe angulata TaxID=980116 RepID=A0A8H6I8H2_9AGAR|nr:EstA protein [Tulosesus angulatus]